MTGADDALRDGLAGAAPANIVLMRLLIAADAPEAVDRALAGAARDAPESRALDAVARLWRTHRGAWDVVRRVAASADHAAGATSTDATVARWTAVFDRLAAEAPDAGVALYGLGDADLTARATAGVVNRLDDWGLLGPDRDALELGCGSGRFVRALAPHMRAVTGLDVSGGMVAEARRRCADLPNVRVERSGGRDLGGIANRSVDLVLAVDVFPYLVEGGEALVDRHVAESARVLRPGGSLLILNYAYRGDLARDRAEAAGLAARHGLATVRLAAGDFALWDGATFHFRLDGRGPTAPRPAAGP